MLPSLIGIIASSGGAAAGGDYESIATVTVGSGGSSSITFSSIPSTYQHLQIRHIGRDASGGTRGAVYINFNSDTGSNYAYHGLYGEGSSAGAFAGTSSTYIFGPEIAGAGSPSNVFGAGVTDVLDYANSNKYKTTRSLSGEDNNGSGQIRLLSGLWMNTAAITSITLTPTNPNFSQYSQFALYGIKG